MNAASEVERLRAGLENALHFSGTSANVDFYISSLTEHNPHNSTEDIIDWLAAVNDESHFDVQPVQLAELGKWQFDPWRGDLQHESGRFFSIRGLSVHTSDGPVRHWTQPVIDQPEVGVLGIVTKMFDGILYFLLQAKAEPGNINTYQLSPTVQATRSNYLRVHGGAETRYLEYFLDPDRARVLIDQLQSEQGARFYKKRNRNIIVRVDDDEDIRSSEDFRWLTLGQIKRLGQRSNTLNMDTRSVISMICYDPENRTSLAPVREDVLRECVSSSWLTGGDATDLAVKIMVSTHGNSSSVQSDAELLRWITAEKFGCEVDARLIPLNEVEAWRRGPYDISHVDGRYFSVIGVRVKASGREVASWDQPIVKQVSQGIVGFIGREFEGVLHFLVQLKVESGNMDILELAPSVQCITDSYDVGERPLFLENFLVPQCASVVFDTLQSEEGGRFYREENRNMLLMGDERFPTQLPSRYTWCSMRQLKELLRYNNFLNVEARSILALI